MSGRTAGPGPQTRAEGQLQLRDDDNAAHPAWHETGTLTMDGGQAWTRILDMDLVETCDASMLNRPGDDDEQD